MMRPTNDFKARVMSQGKWLQVLSPQWLADKIKRLHQKAIERYDSNQQV